MRKSTSWMLVAVALACLWAAGLQNPALESLRVRSRAAAPGDLENAPPIMVFTTVVLGGFRGLVADLLWLRVTYLQDEGRYVELVQLSDWITKLEPNSTEIWTFHAWNLAYNVSVMMPDDEDRWRWVKSGIRLLRDEGVVYNPGDPDLYAELAWIFLHKIGQDADQAHVYYKRKWAEEMVQLLGGSRADYARLESQPEVLGRMRREYRLLPPVMKELEARYGAMDWTRPESHALYWAYRGKLHARGKPTRLCDTIIRQSVRVLFETPSSGSPAAAPAEPKPEKGQHEPSTPSP